jgi:uncharacterized delta-60 repeat protein
MKRSNYFSLIVVAVFLMFTQTAHAQDPCVPANTTPGSLDTCFGNGGISAVPVSGSIVESAIQSDGKILILFSNSSSGNKLVRFNPDGTPDSSYGAGGIKTFSWPMAGGGVGVPWGLALQTDGGVEKIVVGGHTKMQVKGKAVDSLRVDRYLPDGTLDPNFGSGGTAIYKSSSAGKIAIQSNQKIVSVGDLGQITRLNANGTLDTSFGSGGTASGNSLVLPNAIAVQPDDKIVVAGYSSARNKVLATVARYNSNGSVDTTFGSSGRATANFLGGKAWDVVIAPDESIIAGGTTSTASAAQDAAAARFTSAGQLDSSFGIGGVATYDSGIGDVGWRIGLQPDGKVLVTGNTIDSSSTSKLLTTRFDAAGNVDFSFGEFGGAITDVFGGGATSRGVFMRNVGTAEAPVYRIFLAGSAWGSGQSYAVVASYIP